jgi:preprotein translocase subunit SecE
MSVKAGEKKPSFFKKIGRKFKEVFSELKKVTWPSFGKIVKTTGVVLAVVLFFLVIIGLVDFGLSWLIGKITSLG